MTYNDKYNKCDGPLRKLTMGLLCEHNKAYPDCHACREYCESCNKIVYGYNHERSPRN